MAFEIGGFEDIEFDIPAGKDKKITISVPPIDCLPPDDIAAMNKQLAVFEANDELADVQNPAKNGAAMLRFQLKYFNPGKQKADAIDALVDRQLRHIDRIWGKSAEIELGESESSTDESSDDVN